MGPAEIPGAIVAAAAVLGILGGLLRVVFVMGQHAARLSNVEEDLKEQKGNYSNIIGKLDRIAIKVASLHSQSEDSGGHDFG